MDKWILGNFLSQANKDFPVDCELFAALQSNQAMLAIIGNIAGDKTILYGCEPEANGTRRRAGYVFVRTVDCPRGEVLYFEGGATQRDMYVRQQAESVTSSGVAYPHAYTHRWLAPGAGDESYSWDDFKELRTVHDLAAYDAVQDRKIALLQPTPAGVVQMWAGGVTAGALPTNYLLCDGAQLRQSDYPELYKEIGRIHTPSSVPAGYFCLPDLRSRFVAGYNSAESDYNAIGKKGGEARHTLTASEMPSHTHNVNDYYYLEASSGGSIGGADPAGSNRSGSGSTDKDNSWLWYKTHPSQATGGGAAHENRPPYYTLAYIIKVK